MGKWRTSPLHRLAGETVQKVLSHAPYRRTGFNRFSCTDENPIFEKRSIWLFKQWDAI